MEKHLFYLHDFQYIPQLLYEKVYVIKMHEGPIVNFVLKLSDFNSLCADIKVSVCIYVN